MPPSTEINRLVKKPSGPLRELTDKQLKLADYMVNGGPDYAVQDLMRWSPTEDDPSAMRPIKPFEPLRLEEAAKAIFMSIKSAKQLFKEPIFQRALALELNSVREAAKPNALRRVVALVDEEGENKAADRKVMLQAAQMLLGDAVGPSHDGKSQAVNVNVGVTLQAGIVIRLPPGIQQPPLELQREKEIAEGL